MTTLKESGGTFWRKFAPLFGAGVVGVAAITPILAPQLAALPGVSQQSLPVVVGAALAVIVEARPEVRRVVEPRRA